MACSTALPAQILKDGRIAEHWAEVAMLELLQQTGVIPKA
jgi:hypothetical protein